MGTWCISEVATLIERLLKYKWFRDKLLCIWDNKDKINF